MRLNELRALTDVDVDVDLDVAIVLGKGRRPRSCPFSSKTATALDRYLRPRSRHPRARIPALRLAQANVGALTDNGIAQMLRRRGRAVSIEGPCTPTSSATPSLTSG